MYTLRLWRLRLCTLCLCSTTHYDITMANDVARDAHCKITMGNDITRDIHCDITMYNDIVIHAHITMHNNVAMNLLYYVLL